jgi:hypothetical protein
MKLERYSIQIVPDLKSKNKIRKLMISLSNTLNKKDALIDRAHITLITSFKTREINSLIKEIKNLELKPFEENLVGPLLFKDSFLYLKPTLNKKIKEIHNKLINLIPKYREKWVHEGFQNSTFKNKQKEYLKKYGDAYCKEFFTPHLTLTGFSFDKAQLKKIKGLINIKKEYSIKINKILVLKKIRNKWLNYKIIKLK